MSKVEKYHMDMVKKIARASNQIKPKNWALDQIKEENSELTIAASRLLRGRDKNHDSITEEMSDVWFLMVSIMEDRGIILSDLAKIIIDKTKERHPGQWDLAKKEQT